MKKVLTNSLLVLLVMVAILGSIDTWASTGGAAPGKQRNVDVCGTNANEGTGPLERCEDAFKKKPADELECGADEVAKLDFCSHGTPPKVCQKGGKKGIECNCKYYCVPKA